MAMAILCVQRAKRRIGGIGMNWRNDTIPREFDANEQLKEHVKGELMNYYLYLGKWKELEENKNRIRNRSIGSGSIIQMPDGNSSNDSVQHRIAIEIATIEQQQKIFVDKLEKICRWMDMLTLSQYKIVRVYVMRYRCKNAKVASDEIGYEKDTLYQYTIDAVDRIVSKINKIL